MRDLESLVQREILNQQASILPQSKESTIGGSSVETIVPSSERPFMAKTIAAYLQNQRANLAFQAVGAE